MNSYVQTSPTDRGRLFFAGATMMDFLRRLAIDEDGPTAVEYAVMLALIIVVCLATITTLGLNANTTFNTTATAQRPPQHRERKTPRHGSR